MSVKTITELQSQIQSNITSNTGTRGITAPILGGTLADMVDSLPASDKNTAYVTCATQGSTDAKTIDLTDFSLSTGVRLLVKMEHAVTSGGSAISLEINSTGAKPLIYNGAAASSSNTWADNDILDIYYNGSQYVAVPFLGADDEPTEDSRQLVRSGGVYDAIAGSADGVKDWADELFAKQDGSYDTLAAGTAKNLEGGSEKDWTGMGPHVTGNDTNFDFGNGLSEINKVEGNSSGWNQLIKNPNFINTTNWAVSSATSFTVSEGVASFTPTAQYGGVQQNFSGDIGKGHKFYVSGWLYQEEYAGAYLNGVLYGTNIIIYSNPSIVGQWHYLSNIYTAGNSGSVFVGAGTMKSSGWTEIKTKNIQLIDLTLLGIDNLTTVAQVEAWLDKNVGLKPYYPYDAGSLLSVKMQGIKTIGRNLCSVSGTTGTANLPAYDYDDGSVGGVHNRFFISGTYSGLSFTDCYGVQSNPVPDSDGLFSVSNSGVLTVSGAGSDVYVCMDYDGTYSDAESAVPYEENTRYIDVTHIYGKLNGEGSLVQVFPDGMRGVGTVHDEITEDGTAVVRIGNVNLGTCGWLDYGTNHVMGFLSKTKIYGRTAIPNICCPKYVTTSYSNVLNKSGQITIHHSNAYVWICDSAFEGKTGAQIGTALSGVMLDYELATPLEYTDLVYQGSSYYADGTPVELGRIKEDNWGTEEIVPKNPDGQAVTMCSPTVYMTYALDAVETIKTMIDSGIHTDELRATLNNLLAVMNEHLELTMGGTIDISVNPVDKVFTFTFTPTEETPSEV